MPTVKITNVETVKGNTKADLFHPFNDRITLRLTLAFSPDVSRLPQPTVAITYQTIELRTDHVFEQWRFSHKIPAGWQGMYAWVVLPIAQQLGLNWVASDIFGFRGAAELFSFQGRSGLKSIDAQDVSAIHWFRLEAVFTL
jgi:hypothetical protein